MLRQRNALFTRLRCVFLHHWEHITCQQVIKYVKGQRKLHNEELCYLYSSRNIAGIVKLKGLSKQGNFSRNDYLIDQERNGWSVLKFNLRK